MRTTVRYNSYLAERLSLRSSEQLCYQPMTDPIWFQMKQKFSDFKPLTSGEKVKIPGVKMYAGQHSEERWILTNCHSDSEHLYGRPFPSLFPYLFSAAHH